MNKEQILKEVILKAVRSSGSGGQHVNKVATKVVLSFSVENSEGLTDQEKELIREKLATRINKEGELILSSGTTRSQLRNKEVVIRKLFSLLQRSLQPKKKRKATRIPKSAQLKRLQKKRLQSQKKADRKKPKID
ncbi:MAG: alternative ribosome rescue aminoacyl-tRNA hydrolase ArfB [bacterium]